MSLGWKPPPGFRSGAVPVPPVINPCAPPQTPPPASVPNRLVLWPIAPAVDPPIDEAMPGTDPFTPLAPVGTGLISLGWNPPPVAPVPPLPNMLVESPVPPPG